MVTKLNLDWLFHLGDVPDAGMMAYDDSAWRSVTLPHDWAVEHPFDRAFASGTGYLPGGTGWYRKHLTLGDDTAGCRVRLTFEGIYKHARIWVNSHYLGTHAYGYTSFTLDVTPFVRPGENVIAIRVEHEDIADSRWYTGSGIDRNVLLDITGTACFVHDSVFIRTEDVTDDGTALICVDYETYRADAVQMTLTSRDGTVAAAAGADKSSGTVCLRVPKAQLWSPDDPCLYTLHCEAFADGRTQDSLTIPAGIRTFVFDADKGFFLNGKGMKIKGVCVHHDAGCLGAAVPKTVWERRLRSLKSMGCNALRTAHNPPDPSLLDLCDELGFLVMDEAFDEWEGIKNKWWQGHNVYPPRHFGYAEDFPEWHVRDLESMIRRDRNHVCIVLWSIGNEIDYPNDPYVTPLFREVLGNNDADKPLAERLYDVRKPDASRLAAVARELVDIVHGLDPTRPVTSALSFPELSNRTGFADALDLSGYNYRESFYETDHQAYPGRVILGSENSHDPAAWLAVRERDYISSQFLWTGVDFLGECRGWPLRISQAGALDLAGFEKPAAALRRALWTDQPCLRIAVGGAEDHGPWLERFRWEGTPGETKAVSVYTNAPEAELFLNGRSLGVRQCTDRDCRLQWQVHYEDGVLEAAAGGMRDTLATPGKAVRITLACDSDTLTADGLSVCQTVLRLLDADDRPAQDEKVHVQTLGDLTLLGIENGRPDDLTPYSETWRSTRDGQAILYLRAGTLAGVCLLHVWTENGLTAQLSVRVTHR